MLNSAEHRILNAHKYKKCKKFSFFHAQRSLECYFSCSLMSKCQLLLSVGILIIMSRKNFMFSWVEHEKSFITSGHGLVSRVKDLLLTYYLLTIHNGEVKYLRTNKSFERITLFHCIYFRKLIVRGDNGILYAMLQYQWHHKSVTKSTMDLLTVLFSTMAE